MRGFIPVGIGLGGLRSEIGSGRLRYSGLLPAKAVGFFSMRKTKIVATVGPACAGDPTLAALIREGADLLRINASHTTPKGLREWILRIRKVSASLKREVGILVDLQGPRVRTGPLKGGRPLVLKAGEEVSILTGSSEGSGRTLTTLCREFPRMVRRGDRILLDNGTLELRALRVEPRQVSAQVISGGVLGQNKGINLPNAHVTLPALTETDLSNLGVAAGLEVDYMALSFVRTASDVADLKGWMKRHHKAIPVIAKIEKPSALDHLNEILAIADGLMVARGDLGIEMGLEKIPAVQKQLIQRANQAGLPVITATQMLETMIENRNPTRAEVSDVANAVFDSTDAVMLSGETAVGQYPLEAVRMMAKIAVEAERHSPAGLPAPIGQMADPVHAITQAAYNAATALKAAAIVVFTRSGKTAQLVSKLRPACPILALSSSGEPASRLTLFRGVIPLSIRQSDSTDDMIRKGDAVILRTKLLKRGDAVVIVSGRQALPAARYMTKIHHIGED